MVDKQLENINSFVFEGVLKYKPIIKDFKAKQGHFVMFLITQGRKLGKNNKELFTTLQFVSFREQVVDDMAKITNQIKIRAIGTIGKSNWTDNKGFKHSDVKFFVDEVFLVEDLNTKFEASKYPTAKEDDVAEEEEKPLTIEEQAKAYERKIGHTFDYPEIAKDPNHPRHKSVKEALAKLNQAKAISPKKDEPKKEEPKLDDEELPF